MKKNNKGFTLAELLIVVAIIAVLVAIAIPVFSAQLEKSREATDLANVRSAYATLIADYLTSDKAATAKDIKVAVNQKEAKWQNLNNADNYPLVQMRDGSTVTVNVPAATSGSYTVKISASGEVSVTTTAG